MTTSQGLRPADYGHYGPRLSVVHELGTAPAHLPWADDGWRWSGTVSIRSTATRQRQPRQPGASSSRSQKYGRNISLGRPDGSPRRRHRRHGGYGFQDPGFAGGRLTTGSRNSSTGVRPTCWAGKRYGKMELENSPPPRKWAHLCEPGNPAATRTLSAAPHRSGAWPSVAWL